MTNKVFPFVSLNFFDAEPNNPNTVEVIITEGTKYDAIFPLSPVKNQKTSPITAPNNAITMEVKILIIRVF